MKIWQTKRQTHGKSPKCKKGETVETQNSLDENLAESCQYLSNEHGNSIF